MFSRFIRDIKRYLPYSIASAKAQLKSEVANSYLNWLWWILEPLCFMLIYSFIFGHVFNAREQYYPIFIFIGISAWDFFNRTVLYSVKSVKNNSALVTRIYFPKYILIIAKIWVNGFKMFISFGIVLLMMIVYRVPISWNILWFFPIILALGVFTFGCSCFLLHFGVYVEDLANVTTIILRAAFYATGVFYNLETRLSQWGPLLGQCNPIAFLISSLRRCMIYMQSPDWKLLLIWLVISLLVAMAGVYTIYKEENSYVKAI